VTAPPGAKPPPLAFRPWPWYVRAPLVAAALFLMWWPLYALIDVMVQDLRYRMPRKLGPQIVFPCCWVAGIFLGMIHLDWRPPRRFAIAMAALVFTPLVLVFTPAPRWIAAALVG
jgi:hypothetical protein